MATVNPSDPATDPANDPASDPAADPAVDPSSPRADAVGTSHATPPGVAALAARLSALLPQTQCTRCGYPDCDAYAHAVAVGDAPLNQCPPGGAQGVDRLAGLLQRPALALNPANGVEGPRRLVFVDEARCIGCTLCIQACPVDAIIGAPKRMHAVVEAVCTGCELCLPVCPVDCIVLENASGSSTGWAAWSPAQADEARARYLRRQARAARDDTSGEAKNNPGRDAVQAALARARLRATTAK